MTQDITVVTPPSLFLPALGPRIVLIGEGVSWKTNIIKMARGETPVPDANFDVQIPPTFYYCDDEEDYNWIYFQLPHMHQIIYYYGKDTEHLGSVLFGSLLHDDRLNVLHDNSVNAQSVLFLYADKSKSMPSINPSNILISVYDACC